jgi:hypothetical protein
MFLIQLVQGQSELFLRIKASRNLVKDFQINFLARWSMVFLLTTYPT